MSLGEMRDVVRMMLDENSPADAPTAYYALYHDPARSALFVERDAGGNPLGFVARCQTGLDLFRPLVTLKCRDAGVLSRLLARALVPGRPYLLFANLNQLPMLGSDLEIGEQRIYSIYYLDPARFRPVVNVMVVHNRAPNGTPRCEIRSGGLQAVAGVNWQSPGFAEIYVHTEPLARKRGWGRSVVAACTEEVLKEGRIPLYLVEPHNEESVGLAMRLGYVDTGARQVFAEITYKGDV